MTKQNRALGLALVIVVAAALVAIFTQSRTFAQTMGQDYDPGQVQAIHAGLAPKTRSNSAALFSSIYCTFFDTFISPLSRATP